MPIDTPSLIEALLEHRLLDQAAEASLPELSLTSPSPADLVAELVRRRWLTHFQAELLLAGRASELVVSDKYVLLERLGQGGMGTVYKARHRMLKAVRAVKIIHPERLTGPNAVRRFFQEVEAVGKLFHPNIILPHDAGDANGVYWLAMEYVPGADLGRMLERSGPLPASDASEYIRQGALALQHAHERGLVHRDIKPANLLVSSADGRVKLLDLGLARVRAMEEGAGPQTALTQAGAVMGTPDYMAPEQAVDSHGVDIRADIYALSCTLYHILAGRPPFAGGSVMEKLIKHRNAEAEAIESIRQDLPSGLGNVIRKAMAKSPEGRYQTPAELAAALAPYCAGASMAKPRPAGASGVHPIFPALTRPSLAAVGGATSASVGSEQHVQPTPPGNPTMKAPPGAMSMPSDRTVRSLETHLEATVIPQAAAALPQPARPKRKTHWPAVVAMVVIGVGIAVGARFLKKPEPNPVAEGQPPTTNPPSHTETARPPTTEDQKTLPPPEKTLLALGKPGGKSAGEAALARSASRGEPVAFLRPISFTRREPLYRLRRDHLQAVNFSAGGGWAAVLSQGNLDIYNLSKRGDASEGPGPLDQLDPELSDPARTPTTVALSADGRNAYLTAALVTDTERDGKPKGTLFNVVVHHEYGQAPEKLFGLPVESGNKPELTCVAVSPDGSVLAAGTLKSGTASWWNGAVKPVRRREFKHLCGEAVSALAFSADGKRVLFCGRDGNLRLHTLGLLGGPAPLLLQGHPKGARCAAFSADGRFAVSGGTDGKICIWDFTGPPPADGFLGPAKELKWHEGEVYSVAFAPAGDRFVSGGEDGYFCMGEVSRSDLLLHEQPDAAPARVHAVAFTRDGSYALYATNRSIGRYLVTPTSPGGARSSGGDSNAIAKPLSVR